MQLQRVSCKFTLHCLHRFFFTFKNTKNCNVISVFFYSRGFLQVILFFNALKYIVINFAYMVDCKTKILILRITNVIIMI